MTDRRDLAALPEPDLETALRDLGRSLAWPGAVATTGAVVTTDDAAARARRRIVAAGTRPTPRRWTQLLPTRRVRSSLVLAVAAVLVLAAIAAAIGLGLPGIRITVTGSPLATATGSSATASAGGVSVDIPSPSASPGPLGWTLGLGAALAPERARASVSFPVRLPPETLGAPASAWFLDARLSVVWPSGPRLPSLDEPGIGLILTELQGGVDSAYFDKVVGPGTTIRTVRVDGVTGYWISGRPHEIIYVDPFGNAVPDSRRIAGDTLLWAKDGITYRLESALGEDGAIVLANSLR